MPALSPPSKLIIITILFFSFSATTQANAKTPEQTRGLCQKMINEAREETRISKYTSALEKLLRVESVAAENNWEDLLWVSKYHIGIIYSKISNFGESLDYYLEAFVITQKNEKLRKYGSFPLEGMGVLYVQEKKYKDALSYMKSAYEMIEESGDGLKGKKNTANNIASILNHLNRPKESLKILSEVEAPSNDKRVDFLWKTIYIEAVFKNGQVLKAKNMANELHNNLANVYEYEVCRTCLNNLLSEIYAALNKTDSAIYFSHQALNNTIDLIDRIDFYKNISDLYLKKGDLKTALLFKDSVIQTTDSLSAKSNMHLYEVNKVKFKVNEYQQELSIKKKQQRTERKLFVITLILGLITLFSIYKALRNKMVKQKQAALIANLELEKEKKELETNKLKQQQLKHEIAEKNRELTARALHLTNRNDLIQDIVKSLESNKNTAGNKEVISKIKTMKDLLKSDHQQNDFMKHFENVNPGFIKILKEKHPSLNANDIRFLCYIFMNLSLKEICSVFNISYNACIIRKQRIMDKMNLDKKDGSLYDYILKLSQ